MSKEELLRIWCKESVRLKRFLAGIVLAAAAAGAFAGDAEEDFARGYAAYQAGRYTEAATLWLQAAERGHARAQNGLGVLYEEGLGVERDLREAARWFRESSENGYALAMHNLGLLYRDGNGVPRDDVEAHKWLNLASSLNFDEKAAFERELLARRMTPEQLAEARARAQAWFERFLFEEE
ncbi:MAG: tetratricopeptide repeat protein [Burkholderiales bacterium]